MQSFFVPALATFVGIKVLPLFFTLDKDVWSLPLWVQFLLPFTLIDYLYYWNHRLMHRSEFWWLHRVHHTSRRMDVFVTSRNSLWTVLFFIYIWAHAFLIFSQQDPSGYLYGMYVLAALDLWRHSGFKTPNFLRKMGLIFILPEDHSWHHSTEMVGVNFGANLNLWDRIHGTFYRNWEFPKALGEKNPDQSLWINLFFPWKAKL
ncbi:MAG: sterol desaturase family protein [Bdellovibrionaceae bacterium]|nr:sterol desaturase family protein [Pseudobdellovibrionaceae bacterium]